MMDASLYLRPTFTSKLAKRLLNGDSINLIGQHGQGRRRTLIDLRHHLGDSMQIYHMNMRLYPSDYKAFLKDFNSQANHLSPADSRLSSLLSLLSNSRQKSLLILHNFDELMTAPKHPEGYPEHFLDQLNRIDYLESIALLTISEKRELAARLHIEEMVLPTLNYEQLCSELKQRAAALTESERHELAKWLCHHSTPYSTLDSLQLTAADRKLKTKEKLVKTRP